jgi:hypothetical protein
MLSKLLETRQILGNAESGKTWTAEAIAAVASLRPDASTINFGSAPIRNARSQAPIFSIGCSRSGTTLLYQDAAIGRKFCRLSHRIVVFHRPTELRFSSLNAVLGALTEPIPTSAIR